ncbi:ABC transporter ATP-binding protein/permease [Streptacidiphilus sp. EB129]|uniref:ABC transporter ATP-binding protein/permease n=1 Tax=Streptacidiphilus sp. EB129 TaxID=3156262 RepID=UPI0035195866
MSTSTALLSQLADDRTSDGDAQGGPDRLRAWAALGRADLRRAGTLRGLAQLGTVLWAAGLAWAAERGLAAQHSQAATVTAVLPAAGLVATGLALRAALLSAGDSAAARGARTVREELQRRLLQAALPSRGALRIRRGLSTGAGLPTGQGPPTGVELPTGQGLPSRGGLPIRGEAGTELSDAAVAEAADGEIARLTDWLTGYVPARTTMLLGSSLVLAAIACRSWFVALMLLAATPLLPANLKVIGLGTQAAVHAQLTAVRQHSARLLDQLRGLPTLVGLGAHQQAARALREDDEELARRTQTVLRVAFLSTAWIELLITGTLAVVATYCGLVLLDYLHLPGVPGRMSLGTALFVLTLTPAYFAPARDLARGYHARAQAAAAAELIAQALGPENPGTTAAAPEDSAGPSPVSGTGAPGLRPDRVTVRYPHREAPALDEVGLVLAAGQVLAVTGPSGAGKSTLLAIVAGLLEPDSGRCALIRDDGPQAATPTLVSWVGQPAHLLPGTVRDNLLLARHDATDEDLLAAAAELGFQDLLAALPQGLDTPLGERGLGLSSGQSQQLVLIRALLRDAPLLCLDEPTAHLDPQAEQRVVAALRTLVRDRTVLLATHSPALLPLADQIRTLDRGKLR